ncbi:deleted in malignant brain tumors 1 protein-like [Trachemys scripta elegans]|uniref:deleted in malignant brain tumors 1 protein-like n=1 Tax=Trachemys scripta elegans TaxID=31138 RepID=UPI001553024C|nr:deleted in malignant brain tumors 1 protein-like [Trachemys scripta elegans]
MPSLLDVIMSESHHFLEQSYQSMALCMATKERPQQVSSTWRQLLYATVPSETSADGVSRGKLKECSQSALHSASSHTTQEPITTFPASKTTASVDNTTLKRENSFSFISAPETTRAIFTPESLTTPNEASVDNTTPERENSFSSTSAPETTRAIFTPESLTTPNEASVDNTTPEGQNSFSSTFTPESTGAISTPQPETTANEAIVTTQETSTTIPPATTQEPITTLPTPPPTTREPSTSTILLTTQQTSMTISDHYIASGETAPPDSSEAPKTPVALTCLPEYMRAVIRKAYIRSKGYFSWNFHLNDPTCRPMVTKSDVIFHIPYDGCGTKSKVNNGTIDYSNTVRASTSDKFITRAKRPQLHFTCRMNQSMIVDIMHIVNESDSLETDETQYGRFNVKLSFYEAPSFSSPVKIFPYFVDLNQDLYIQATLYSLDPNLMLFIDTCVTSPDSHDFTTVKYDLIKRGCVKDDTYTAYYSSNKKIVQFHFKAFQFFNGYSTVYLQCKMVVCKVYDTSSRCYQGCVTRTKRNTSSGQENVTVVGPVKLK